MCFVGKTTEVKCCSHLNTGEGHTGDAVSGHLHEVVPLVFPNLSTLCTLGKGCYKQSIPEERITLPQQV